MINMVERIYCSLLNIIDLEVMYVLRILLGYIPMG